jgi:hypothetical protein
MLANALHGTSKKLAHTTKAAHVQIQQPLQQQQQQHTSLTAFVRRSQVLSALP